MKRKLIFQLLCICVFYDLHAQTNYNDPKTISLPSVNNQFFVSNSSYDVSLYTGTPTIKTPLCELSSRELNIPISLSYVDCKGIKVQDVANFVGLGWKLNAGGSISRVVRGLADEQPNGYIGTSHFGQTINTAGASGLTSDIINKIGNGQYDGEPDLFKIETSFFTFQFLFDQNGNPVIPNNNGYKIIHNLANNSNPQSTSFTVIDDLGNQYFFGSSSSSRENVTDVFGTTTTSFTSVWYLDKIISYNSHDQITFSYTQGADYSVNHYSSNSTTFNTTPTCSISNVTNNNITHTTTYNAPKYISYIVSSLGEVDFSYLWDRRDVTNAARLTSITMYPFLPGTTTKGALLKSYQFNYSYFGDPSTIQDQLRLRLDYINLLGNGSFSTTPLKIKWFDYNLSLSLPIRSSYEFDYWGYYNVNTSGTALPPSAVKTPDLNRTSANILTTVHDIEGSSTTFQYELNDYFDQNSSSKITVGGLRVKSITKSAFNGDNLITQYSYVDDNNKSTGQINSLSYLQFSKVVNALFVNGGNSCAISGTNTNSESIYSAFDLNGILVGYSSVKTTNPNGGYVVSSFTNFSDYPDIYTSNTSNNQTYSFANSKQVGSPTSFAFKRGLILDEASYNASKSKVSEVQYFYNTQTTPVNKALSLRVMPMTFIVGSSISVWTYGLYYADFENFALSKKIEYKYDQNVPPAQNSLQKTTNYSYLIDNTVYNTLLLKGIASTDSKKQAISKTIYYPTDASIPMLSSADQTAINSMLQMNRTNIVIHETDSRNGVVTQRHNSYVASSWNGNLNGSLSVPDVYLNSSSTYNKDAQPIRQALSNFDLPFTNLISSNSYMGPASSSSPGKATSFMYGYNLSYPIAKIENSSSAVSSYTSQQTTGSATISPAAMPGSVSFTVGYTGNVVVSLSITGTPTSSYLTTVACTLSGPTNNSFTLCYGYQNSGCGVSGGSATIYVTPGNYVLNASISSNSNSAYMPYISCAYPAININKVVTNEFFYEGFEENSSASSGSAHTGNKYWNGAYTVPYSPANGKIYTIQYWSLSGTTWQFNEATYSANMTLPGPVDDIRVFPKTAALMTTYTYSPLLGITSQTDPSGRSTYYQYDGLGRLQTILDQDKNVVKQYDYEYQMLAAPVYNTPQTLSYQKTNCPSGYTGLYVPLTVAANTYKSYISIPDANQQAINYLNSNGPTNANSQPVSTGCALNTTATVTCNNGVGQTGYTIKFTNTSTSQVSTVSLPATSTTINLPYGTYNITVTTTLSGGVIAAFCSQSAQTRTGTSVTISNVSINASTCNTLTVNSYL